MIIGKHRAQFVTAALATIALIGCAGTSASPSPGGPTSPPASPTMASTSGAPSASTVAALPPTFEIDAASGPSGMGYTFPQATAPAGWVTIKLVNQDPQLPHQAQLFRLHEGTTVDAFTKALMTPPGEGAVISLADPMGGPNAISGSSPVTVYVRLDAGATYMVICAIPAPDGMPHYADGMIGHFIVGQAGSTAAQSQPASTITLSNFMFMVPDGVDWAKPIDVVNQGTEPHELVLVGAAPGKTIGDVKAALQAPPGAAPAGPPPYVFLGGMAAIAPGSHEVFQPQVPAGDYLLVCFITDPNTGKPHFALGMMTPFTAR